MTEFGAPDCQVCGLTTCRDYILERFCKSQIHGLADLPVTEFSYSRLSGL